MKITDLDWGDWIYALFNAAIGGGATSVSGWLGAVAAKSLGADVPSMNWNTLWIYWLAGSLSSFFFYLKQSPLPKIVSETTTTVSVKETTTAQPEPPKP